MATPFATLQAFGLEGIVSKRTQKIDLFLRQQRLDNDERPPAKALFQ
jgi:hypothetical protein